ncbi:MAG: outer membrane protein assembly factor BamB family protein [Alphaproteobacteria bacterium]
MINKYICFLLSFFLLGCATEDMTPPLEGERISLSTLSQKIDVDLLTASKEFSLPTPERNNAWPQIDANPAHLIGHYALPNTSRMRRIWRRSIGTSTKESAPFISAPVLHNQRIFAMDRKGLISAIDIKNGAILWTKNIKKENAFFMRGGLAVFEDRLIATYGTDEIIALNVRNGKTLWTKKTGATPFKSVPILNNQSIYALTVDNRVYAFDAKTGETTWFHDGLLKPSSLLRQSAPSVRNNMLLVPYSSGNIFAFNAQTKQLKWSRKIASPAPKKSLSYETDLVAAPILDKDIIFVLGTDNMLSALSYKKGQTIWSLPLGGYETPLISGNWLFAINKTNMLYCLEKTTGKLRWKEQLPKKNEDDELIKWFAPRLAMGKLLLFSSEGKSRVLAPSSGQKIAQSIFRKSFDEEIAHPPIIVNKTLYILTKDATLHAFQ